MLFRSGGASCAAEHPRPSWKGTGAKVLGSAGQGIAIRPVWLYKPQGIGRLVKVIKEKSNLLS